MNRYVAFLRGINVGGKNKIEMKLLRQLFERLQFKNVKTYINSGNVIFDSEDQNKGELQKRIELSIKENFNLDIPVAILTSLELLNIVHDAPLWWGTDNKEVYHNTILMIPPNKAIEVYKIIGEPIKIYEEVYVTDNAIYWTAILKTFTKSRWSKIASSSINNMVTVRNANTVKKLLIMMGEQIK